MQERNENNTWENSIHELKQDFSVAFKFRDNWKPFVATNLFTLILILGLILSSLWLLALAGVIDFNYLNFQISSSQPFVNVRIGRENIIGITEPLQYFYLILVVLIYMFVFIVSTSLEGTLFGLGYEILSSGNEFAEFKSAFKYFKKYWYKFVILSLLFVFMSILIVAIIISIILSISPDHLLGLRAGPRQDNSESDFIFYFIINLIFMFVYPSLIETGSVWKAIKKNFRFLKHAFLRVILINLIFNALMLAIQLPALLIDEMGSIWFFVTAIIGNTVEFLFLKSLRILVVTRAYNSLLFKPIIQRKNDLGGKI